MDKCAVVYDGGLHVVVWRKDSYRQLEATMEVPQTFYNRTLGLVGLWSSSGADDFLMSDGKILRSQDSKPLTEDDVHQFGLSCECNIHVAYFILKERLKMLHNMYCEYIAVD